MDKKNVAVELTQLPREKLLAVGAAELSDEELLALFLRTGKPGMNVMALARYLLMHFGSLYYLLNADLSQFRHAGGVGLAKYCQLKAIAELARRYYHTRMQEESPSLTPQLAREFLQSQLTDEQREIFMVIFLNNQHQVIKHSKLFHGTLRQVDIHPREIVREAIKVNAAALILAHNHPSGNPEPSSADRIVTSQIIHCCQMVDIQILDHFIIGRGNYVSFAERGWITSG